MADTMNMRLIDVADGTATFEALPVTQVLQSAAARARRLCGDADRFSAWAAPCRRSLPADIGYGTIELKVNYVRKLDASVGRLVCTGTVIHAGRTMFTAEAKVVDENGKLYAHGSGTFLVYPT